MLIHEDDGLNAREHFWDIDGGDDAGLLFFIRFHSAFTRASAYFDQAIMDYDDGHLVDAFQKLGRVCHLVQDMGCPAHTLLDPHPDFLPQPLDDIDSLHTFAQFPANHFHSPRDGGMASEASLKLLMSNLANISRQWDSDDFVGKGPCNNGFGCGSAWGTCTNTAVGSGGINGGWNMDSILNGKNISDCDLRRIIVHCMPATERAVARVFQLFYEIVKPSAGITMPTPGRIYNGLNGVPLQVVSSSASVFYIDVEYSLADVPGPNDWILARRLSVINPAAPTTFTGTWFNTLDAQRVLIRAKGVDVGGCNSDPQGYVVISIDSAKPVVKNIKP